MKKLSIEELHRIDAETFKKKEKLPVVIILDNIRSQYNIGSVFRTCDAFRVKEVLLCGISATPPSREIEKSALGSTQSVQWKYFESTTQALLYCKQKNFQIIAIEQTDESKDIRQFHYLPKQSYAFVFGNEVKGIEQSVLNMCDVSIEIPQFGTKHSFNVAVTTAIVLYDFFVKCSNEINFF